MPAASPDANMMPRDLDEEEAASFKAKVVLVFLLFSNPPFLFKESRFCNMPFPINSTFKIKRKLLKETQLMYKYQVTVNSLKI